MNPMRLSFLLLAAALAGCASAPRPSAELAPTAQPCPKGPPEGARCLRGTDSAGAPYLIVMPQQWSGVLVVHAHGGPALGAPDPKRSDEDIERWDVTVRAGHAWAGSVFRQGGVAVTSAAEDTERVRRIFTDHVAKPKRTLLHGQSWGAGVAAKAAELYPKSWDGVLLSSGVLAGGSRSYDFRLDLRVVYQHLCNNHPAPNETAYPLWQGLPTDAKLTRADLATRVEQCLGIRTPADKRTPEQARKLKTIVDVIRIPENQVLAHLNWGTWHFQDIATKRTNGANPFDNARVRYTGSPDDAALNAGVLRYAADPQAAARFAADTDPTGKIDVPVLEVHGVRDPTAFVELTSVFRDTLAAAGRGDRLVQTYADFAEHSYLSDATYLTLFDALLRWVERGEKPSPASVAAGCAKFDAPDAKGCRFLPAYQPAPLAARVAPRDGTPRLAGR